MAPRVSSVLQRLLREQKITPSRTSAGMVQKELEGGRFDLQEAKDSLGLGKYKWATVQAYYSSFHSARGLLYAKNFREQSHRGLLAAIRELYHREIPESLLEAFGDAMSMREAADYGLVYSEDGAETAIETAERILDKASRILMVRRKTSTRQTNNRPRATTQ